MNVGLFLITIEFSMRILFKFIKIKLAKQRNTTMKQFQLRVGVSQLKLKVKFPCKVSLSLKYHQRQHPIFSEKPLLDGQLTSPTKQFASLEAQYDQKQGKISQNQKISLQLYLHSTHGKLLIGSYPYKVNELSIKKTYNERIKNSPDPQAEIHFQIEAVFLSTVSSAISNSLNHERHSQLKKKAEVTNEYYEKRQRFRTQQIETNPSRLLSPPVNSNLQKSNLHLDKNPETPKNLLLKSNVYQKSDVGGLLRNRHFEEGRGKIQSLKQKANEKRLLSSEGNQKYLEKIMNLQKQIRIQHQKINHLELQVKLKDNNLKYQQKEVQSKKDKIQSLEAEIKSLNKTIASNQQRIRQYQYSLKHLTQEHENLEQNLGYQSKKLDKKDEYYKDQLTQLNKKSYTLEKQKDDLNFKIISLNNQLHQCKKRSHEEIREKDRRTNEQKQNLNKKIATLELQLQDSKNQNSSLSADLLTIQSELKDMKIQNERSQTYNNRLRTQEQELLLHQRKLQMDKVALDMELKEEKQTNEQNKELKKNLQQKIDEIDILRKKVKKLEDLLEEAENKVKLLTINGQGLEQEYEKLYYQKVGDVQQLERKKANIADLIEEHEQMEKNMEKLNIALSSQEQEFNQMSNEQKQKIKNLEEELQKIFLRQRQVETELLEEIQKRKLAQKQLNDSKKKIQQNQFMIEQLQGETTSGNLEMSNLKGFYELLQNKNKHITNQFDEYKKQKEEHEDRLRKQIQELEKSLHQKQEALQAQQQGLNKLSNEICQLNKEIEQLHLKNDNQSKENQQISHKLSLAQKELKTLNSLKSSLEDNNSQYKNNMIELHQKNEKFQTQLETLSKEMKEIDLSLQVSNEFVQDDLEKYEPNQENRLKKISILFNNIDVKQNKINQAMINIQNLEGEIKFIKNEQNQLRQELSNKNEDLSKTTQAKTKLQNSVKTSVDELQKMLLQQGVLLTDVDLSLENVNSDEDRAFMRLNQSFRQLNAMLDELIQEKKKIKYNLQQSQANNQELTVDLKKTKELYNSLTNDADQLNKRLSDANEEGQGTKSSIRQLRDKIQQITRLNHSLEEDLREQKAKNIKLSSDNEQNQDKINKLSLEIQKKLIILKETSEQIEEKQKEYNKKITLLKAEVSEKNKQLVIIENQKKNRVQILNQTIDQLRKQNFDLQSIAFSQKSNNTKLNSILHQFQNYIPKIEKAHNIKAYYMMPLKDLLLKFEQIMRASDKMYSDYDKKLQKLEHANFQSKIDSLMKKKSQK